MVRAKFRVDGVEDAYDNQKVVHLTAAIDESNKNWSRFTPHGQLTMTIANEAASDQFKVGEFVFLDISPAPATEAEEK